MISFCQNLCMLLCWIVRHGVSDITTRNFRRAPKSPFTTSLVQRCFPRFKKLIIKSFLGSNCRNCGLTCRALSVATVLLSMQEHRSDFCHAGIALRSSPDMKKSFRKNIFLERKNVANESESVGLNILF